jgi:DNA-binding IclR family transcriptional regulator
VQDRLLARPLERWTDATVTSPDRFRELLDQVRRQGYALLAGHVHPDATGIAVPVRDGLGQVVAALSVILPNDDRAVRAVPALLAAARGVSRALR